MNIPRWPLGLTLMLVVVLVVNLTVAWYAVGNPPIVVPSYDLEGR